MFYELKISKNGLRDFIICKRPLQFKLNCKKTLFNIYDYKLDNSLSRAKSKLFEYVTNNDFKYFVTLTINSNYDRFDLDSFRRRINQIIRNMRRVGFTDLFYILIPELHKNGAVHFHGFFSSGFGGDFYINDNGFLSWASYDRLGFSSISKIKNYKACCKYITKYITKDLCKSRKGKYLYFHSQGLKCNKHIDTWVTSGLLPINYDFSNKYVSKTNLDYYNFVTLLDFMSTNDKILLSECNIENYEDL